MIMDKENAEKELILSQKYILPQSEEEILVKHMLQLILVEVIGRKDEAKEIFYPNLPKKLYTCHIERVLKPA